METAYYMNPSCSLKPICICYCKDQQHAQLQTNESIFETVRTCMTSSGPLFRGPVLVYVGQKHASRPASFDHDHIKDGHLDYIIEYFKDASENNVRQGNDPSLQNIMWSVEELPDTETQDMALCEPSRPVGMHHYTYNPTAEWNPNH